MQVRFMIFFLALFFLPSTSFAHGTGQSLEKEVGQYLIDIGLNTLTLRAGDVVALDFNILEKATGQKAAFTDIWMRIDKQNKVFVAGGLSKAQFGSTFLSYVFPEAGAYNLFVRFQKGEQILAEATFPLVVEANSDTQVSVDAILQIGAGLVIGILLGFGIFFLFFKKKQQTV